MNLTYTLYEYDRNHRLKRPPRVEQSHSFVKAFLQLLYCSASNLTQTIVDIGGVSRTVSNALLAEADVTHPGLDSHDGFLAMPDTAFVLGRIYDISSDEKGIVIGTGSTAITVEDDALDTIIPHGTGSGQMLYSGCWGLNPVSGGGTASFDLERIFRNESGGSIVVAEMGIYAATSMNSTVITDARAFCMLRDVLGTTVTVGDGEYFKVKYTITVSN